MLLTLICSVLIIFEAMLLVYFVRKVYYQENVTVFGNKKTTKYLDRLFICNLVLLFLQNLIVQYIIKSFDYIANGLMCSLLNFFFHQFNLALKFLSCTIVFLFHYIWIKQRQLQILHSSRFGYETIKLTSCWLLTFSSIVSFKTNLIGFFVQDGICLGKKLYIHEFLTKTSRLSVFSVFLLLLVVKFYYLIRTKQVKRKYKMKLSSKSKQQKADKTFYHIFRQIVLFLILILSLLTLFILYYLLIKNVDIDGSELNVVFAAQNYLYQHLYQFLCNLILCVFRFVVPKLSITLQVTNKPTEDTYCVITNRFTY